MRNPFDNIITFIERPLTHAVGEGINCLQKIVKNRASGFRSLKPFADLIFLTIGDLAAILNVAQTMSIQRHARMRAGA